MDEQRSTTMIRRHKKLKIMLKVGGEVDNVDVDVDDDVNVDDVDVDDVDIDVDVIYCR